MNYGIFKDGKYSGDGDQKSAMRRHLENEEKPKKQRRTGCLILLLPVVVIILYLFIKFRM